MHPTDSRICIYSDEFCYLYVYIYMNSVPVTFMFSFLFSNSRFSSFFHFFHFSFLSLFSTIPVSTMAGNSFSFNVILRYESCFSPVWFLVVASDFIFVFRYWRFISSRNFASLHIVAVLDCLTHILWGRHFKLCMKS